MTRPQEQFLELLRSGLWGTPADISMFEKDVDWKSIVRIAVEQAVQVIVADGIETLPHDLWPAKEFMIKLMLVRIKTKQMHQLLNITLNQIVNALDAEGIPSVLLKGQGVAQNYRIPESRMCGDIDLYVGQKNYKRACEIIAALDKSPEHKTGEECDHHMHLQVNGVEVEVHRQADFMPGKSLNRNLQHWTIECIDHLFGTPSLNHWDNQGTTINLASPTFDAFFILHHAVRHMIAGGVGFRQICDWLLFLHKNSSNIDVAILKEKLKEYHMEYIWQEFGILAISVLGLPVTELPLATERSNSRKTEKILREIFISGNFGQYDVKLLEKYKHHKAQGYLNKKWRSFRFQSSRLIKFAFLFPNYSLSYGWSWIIAGMNRVLTKQ